MLPKTVWRGFVTREVALWYGKRYQSCRSGCDEGCGAPWLGAAEVGPREAMQGAGSHMAPAQRILRMAQLLPLAWWMLRARSLDT